MADTKVTSNGNVEVWAVPVSSIANFFAPTATEINVGGLNLTDALAWDGTTFPGSTESDDIDDRSMRDKGNATSRGFASFEAALNFFRPLPTDTTSEAGKAWQMFKTPRVPVYLVTRVLQGNEGVLSPVVAGDNISLYQMVSDTVNDDTADSDSYKYLVSFMPQGNLAVNTQVKATGPVVLSKATMSLAVGAVSPVKATLSSKRVTPLVTWTTSNANVATVSANGVVKAVGAGTATISATHPSATGATTGVTVTVTNP